jgi:hypothetical protein
VNRGPKQSRGKSESADIFADADFDADDFVEQMDDGEYVRAKARTGWRRLEAMQEERLLRKQLGDLEDWDEFGD